jgi:serine/threonine-protein kinase
MAKNPADRFQTADEFASALNFMTGTNAAGTVAQPLPTIRSASAGQQFETRDTTLARRHTPVSSLDPTRIDRVRAELAQFVGPMARILVNRAMKQATTLQQLYDRLADEIVNPDDRRQFLTRRPR